MARIAGEFRLARLTLGLSRDRVARRAGVARSTVERYEAGATEIAIDIAAAVMAAVGLDLVLKAYPGGPVSLRDTGQMTLADQLRQLAAAYWMPRLEVLAGDHGRAADVVLYGAEEILHLEIERHATDFQAQLRSARQKQEVISARSDRPVRLVLVIEDTRKNREALRLHAGLIASQLPADSRAVLRSVRLGRPLGSDGLLWLRRRR